MRRLITSHLIRIYTVCCSVFWFYSENTIWGNGHVQIQRRKNPIKFRNSGMKRLTLVLLIPDMSCLCKQCRSRSVGFWGSQLIWICTVCHSVFEFVSTVWIKYSAWLKIRSGHGILIYSTGQGLSISYLKEKICLTCFCALIFFYLL